MYLYFFVDGDATEWLGVPGVKKAERSGTRAVWTTGVFWAGFGTGGLGVWWNPTTWAMLEMKGKRRLTESRLWLKKTCEEPKGSHKENLYLLAQHWDSMRIKSRQTGKVIIYYINILWPPEHIPFFEILVRRWCLLKFSVSCLEV